MQLLKVHEIPYGIFHVIGRDFNGFHIRFREISRGGVRMIMYNDDNHN
jgi:glutamate dehydrogenase